MATEKPIIIYDAKCGICKNLAYKIHFNNHHSVDIVALSDPESHRMLEQFYPDGWKHDFYVVADGTCRKGLWAIPRLARAIGSKQVSATMAEYASFKLSLKKCGTDHYGNKEANVKDAEGHSRTDFLKYAALSPAALAFTKMPKLDDPLKRLV